MIARGAFITDKIKLKSAEEFILSGYFTIEFYRESLFVEGHGLGNDGIRRKFNTN